MVENQTVYGWTQTALTICITLFIEKLPSWSIHSICIHDLSYSCNGWLIFHCLQATELGRIILQQEENNSRLQKELDDITVELNHTRSSLEDQIAGLEVS